MSEDEQGNSRPSSRKKNKGKKGKKNVKQNKQSFLDVDEPDINDIEISENFIRLKSCQIDLDQIRSRYESGHILFICDIPSKLNINSSIGQSQSSGYVMMPFEDSNYWKSVQDQLSKQMSSATEFEFAIKSINSELLKKDFDVLREFIDNNNTFPDIFDILNGMATLALQLPSVLPGPLPFLTKNMSKTLFLSQKQIACLLANAFFCTFPKRSKVTLKNRGFPVANFASLFISFNNFAHQQIKQEKLKCIFNYFKQIMQDNINGTVSFERIFKEQAHLPEWKASEKNLSEVMVQNSGRMEISGQDFSVVDFANRFIGGGVLNTGAVQEEIMFLICPELLVARLFMESQMENEAIIITGFNMVNSVKGYASTFKWIGDYQDNTERDDLGRRLRQIIAIDAINFKKYEVEDQFDEEFIDRELNKAYIGFKGDQGNDQEQSKPAIVTGKWGCGAYRADPELKYLIQWLAASEAQRQMIFYTFRDQELTNSIKNVIKVINGNTINIGKVYELICRFKDAQYKSIFQFIKDHL